MSKFLQMLRWLCVLPASVLCAFLVDFPIHWAVMLIQLFPHSDTFPIGGKHPLAAIPPEMLERFAYALFNPMVTIIMGAKIAPGFKFPTAVALAVLSGVMVAVITVMSISQMPFFGIILEAEGWLREAITCVLNMAGIGFGLWRVRENETTQVPEPTV